MTADCDTLVWDFFVPLEPGVDVVGGVVAVAVVAVVAVGHFPFTGSEPSGHGVDQGNIAGDRRCF